MTPGARLRSAVAYALSTVPLLARADGRGSTPCRLWSAEELCSHLCVSVADVAGMLGADHPPERPRSWAEAVAALGRGLHVLAEVAGTPERPTPELELLGESTILGVASLEVAVHAWDLRSSVGRSTPVPRALAEALWSTLDQVLPPPSERRGLFADPLEVESISASDRLLAALGRDPRPAAPAAGVT